MVNDEIAATCKTDGNSTIDNVRCNIFLRKFETLANRILAEPPRWQVFLVAFFLERLSPLPLLLFLPSGCEGSLLPPFSSFPALLVNRKKKLLLSLLSLLFVSFFSTGHSRLKERAKFNNNGQRKKKQCLSNAQSNWFVTLLPCSTISSWLNPEPKDAAYCPLEKKHRKQHGGGEALSYLGPCLKKREGEGGEGRLVANSSSSHPLWHRRESDRCAWKSSLPSFLDLIVSIPTPSEGASSRPNELNGD